MELHRFAEQILFAATLEEKLQTPAEEITDERPGPALLTAAAPGRPPELRFKSKDSAKADFPSLHRLDNEPERGRLLHFFANHELLATELMALVLLKFPDAPAAFRRGVLQTLKDEQEHTRLYLRRMQECGIHFGELPVSGYFWRMVSTMENPMDYVATLSLTFEQANLDFARHFARRFAQAGDAASAALLERICRDEIGHVAHGLKWFRRWKNPDESDWAAFCRQLKFPLSPQRAKGFTLNIEGRRAAGLDSSFIAELDVYSRSKGRTPSVFIFNPFAEGRIAQGKAFTASKHQAQLARDLSNLPQFLCRQDDLVLVEQRPSVEFLSSVKRAGFDLPEFVELGAPGIGDRKIGRLRPWAWAPDSVELLQPFFAHLTAEKRTASDSFNPAIAQLYSKSWSAALLKQILSRSGRGDEAHSSKSEIEQSRPTNRRPERGALLRANPTPNLAEQCSALRSLVSWREWLCTENEVGVAVNTLDEALAVIAAIRRRGHHRIVVKQALGLAGGNAIRLFEPHLLEPQRKWMTASLANGRQLVVEPWLDRAHDFSAQLEMTAEGLKLRGYTGLLTDANGQFQGNRCSPKFERRIPADALASLKGAPDVVAQVHSLYHRIFELLAAELRRAGFIGPVGIDAFVYRTAGGDYRLKPIVEINPRYTMGRLTVELMKQVAPGSHGLLRLITRKIAATEGCADFTTYARKLTESFPLKLEGEPVPKIRAGALCLNDPAQAQAVLAVFRVGSSWTA